MTTFAPDTEQDFALFREETLTTKKRERAIFVDWLAEHLRLGGVVVEHYQEHNACWWTLAGKHRHIHGRPLPNGFVPSDELSADCDPSKLAEKLLRRSLRYGVVLSYARPH